jgi:hypothetical protein
MFRYRLQTIDGNDAGEAHYAVMVAPGGRPAAATAAYSVSSTCAGVRGGERLRRASYGGNGMSELGQLLRLKQMIDAAAGVKPTVHTAKELVDSYNHLHANVMVLASELGIGDEFRNFFAGMETPPEFNPVLAARSATKNAAALETAGAAASVRLAELGGWIDGLVAEQTLNARIKADAEARVAAEQKPPLGFTSS